MREGILELIVERIGMARELPTPFLLLLYKRQVVLLEGIEGHGRIECCRSGVDQGAVEQGIAHGVAQAGHDCQGMDAVLQKPLQKEQGLIQLTLGNGGIEFIEGVLAGTADQFIKILPADAFPVTGSSMSFCSSLTRATG